MGKEHLLINGSGRRELGVGKRKYVYASKKTLTAWQEYTKLFLDMFITPRILFVFVVVAELRLKQ